MFWLARSSVDPHEQVTEAENEIEVLKLVGTGRFELPTPRTPSECSTRLSHVPTSQKKAAERNQRLGFFYSTRAFPCGAYRGAACQLTTTGTLPRANSMDC